jgi:hypothetical protein
MLMGSWPRRGREMRALKKKAVRGRASGVGTQQKLTCWLEDIVHFRSTVRLIW